MSLLEKVIKLAHQLDQKGLSEEADILDKFAGTLNEKKMFEGDLLTEDELDRGKKMESEQWMDSDSFVAMFRELFETNMLEHHMGQNEAAASALRTMISLSEQIEREGEPTEEDRARATDLFNDIVSRED